MKMISTLQTVLLLLIVLTVQVSGAYASMPMDSAMNVDTHCAMNGHAMEQSASSMSESPQMSANMPCCDGECECATFCGTGLYLPSDAWATLSRPAEGAPCVSSHAVIAPFSALLIRPPIYLSA
ncbi:hypothetical protein DRW07_03435 [Alteromonas sediminis]|uniref:CopL family metal-binding regulatory protein n=1 Tax=Alteromonas sediminis TaxID=2259342 RepID=A0A3N5YQL0_9ALTE|nr:hypothetical protein [Alteromonas sediminis]RPJ68471.1 hypothetical protein DRW07_03435 [Alteromonas sediminis]